MKVLFNCVGHTQTAGYHRSINIVQNLDLSINIIFLIGKGKRGLMYEMEINNNIRVIKIPYLLSKKFQKRGIDPLDILLRIWAVIKFKYDIFHNNEGFRIAGFIPLLIAKYIFDKKYVTEWYDLTVGHSGQSSSKGVLYRLSLYWWDNIIEPLDKKIADYVLPLSEFLYTRTRGLNIQAEKIYVLRGAADVKNIIPIDKFQAQNKLSLSSGYIYLGYVGMDYLDYKSFYPIIEIQKQLTQKGFKVKILTTGQSLSPSIKLKWGINQENIVEFGWLKNQDYNYFLAASNILISLNDDTDQSKAKWPNKIGDYLAVGRPILVNNIGEHNFIISKCNKGLLILNKNNIALIVEDIEKILNNESLYAYMCNHNRVFAEQELSWRERSAEINRIYQKLI